MALYSFEGNAPQIAGSAYVHESVLGILPMSIGKCGVLVKKHVNLCHSYKEGLKKL